MSDTHEATDGFDDYLPLSAVYIAPGEYKIVAADGHRLWYMEGASLAEWICESVNTRMALKEWKRSRYSSNSDDHRAADEVLLLAVDALEGKK